MKKVMQRNIIPVLPILIQKDLLPLMQENGNIGSRYPMKVYGFDGVTLLGIAKNPAQLIELVNDNVDNQEIGTIKRYKNIPYAFELTPEPLYVGVLPTNIKVEMIY